MRVKYVPFFTENMEETLKFFTEKLKFKAAGDAGFYDNAACRIVQGAGSDVLIAIAENREYRQNKNQLILNTTDCLNDYHELKAEGVLFVKEPHYTPDGLAAEFTDGFNNRFVLLEERNYNADL